MNIMAFIFTITFMIYLFLGVHLLTEFKKSDKDRKLYVILIILCFVFSFWSFVDIFLISCEHVADCWFWYRIYVPCLVFFPALILHFFLLLTNEKIYSFPEWLYPAIYVPAVIFMIKGFTGILTVSGFVKNSYGWGLIHAVDSLWYTAYSVYYISSLVISLSLTAIWHHKTTMIREKKQAALIFISAFLTSVLNIIINSILPAMNIYVIPQITQTIILLWMIGIWFAIVRYKFMAISPSITSYQILSNIQEMVLLVTPDLKINMINTAFQNRFPVISGSLKNRKLSEILSKDAEVQNHFNLLLEGKEKWFKCMLNFINGSETIAADSYISRITDRFSDLIGILIIARENRGAKHLRTEYKLTEREFEIFDLCIKGISNREIGEKLDIAERTVESHVNNIYNKMNVSNKIELIKLASVFDLIRMDCCETL